MSPSVGGGLLCPHPAQVCVLSAGQEQAGRGGVWRISTLVPTQVAGEPGPQRPRAGHQAATMPLEAALPAGRDFPAFLWSAPPSTGK